VICSNALGVVVSLERETTCEEFAKRVDGFLDGEIDAHAMRAMALHAGSCASCGGDFDRAEALQGLIRSTVLAEVDRIDTSQLWSGIEARLEAPRRGVLAGWRLRGSRERRWLSPVPALALGGALAALLALYAWPTTRPTESIAVADNHAQIERIESTAQHVAVWSEPREHTTAIWVASYEPEAAP
jgi:hypothetical protein